MKKLKVRPFILILLLFNVLTGFKANAGDQIQASGPLLPDSAATNASMAVTSVVRILTQKGTGSGFLHKSGNIITAAHVVANADATNIFIEIPIGGGLLVKITNLICDTNLDLAILMPETKIPLTPLELSEADRFKLGTQVTMWGYPSGYRGMAPLLAVGYLSGMEQSDGPTPKWVINGAINLEPIS